MSQGGSFLPQRSCPNLLERRWSSRLATHMLRDTLCVKHIHSYIMVQMVGDAPRVSIKTSMGNFEVELYVKHAPRSCKNFIELAKRGYYNGTIAHRIISDFMIQMGDPTGTGRGGESIYGGKFEDEIHPELHHTGAGILSMANAGPNTNGSQFFITLAVTPWLDGKHTIFGRVCNGMGVVKRLGNVATDANDRPTSEIKIISAQPL